MSENKAKQIDQGRNIQLRCECGSLWHNVGLEFIDWGDHHEPELYIQTTHGNYLAWHKRIWEALKYVWNGGSMPLDATIITKTDSIELVSIIQDYQKLYDEWQEKTNDT